MANPAHEPQSRIELTFECKSLPRMDLTSKSDPFIVLDIKQNEHWLSLGQTEVVVDSENPKFVTGIQLDYYFERLQVLRARIYDMDDPKKSLESQDKIGEVTFSVGDICGSRSRTLTKSGFSSKNPKATLIVSANEIRNASHEIHLEISGQKLDKKDFLGKSDPYLEISRLNSLFYFFPVTAYLNCSPSNDGKSTTLIYRSPVIKKTLDPVWPPFRVPLSKLPNGDINAPLLWSVFDWDSPDLSKSDFIGSFTASFVEVSQQFSWELINKKKSDKSKKYKNSGHLRFTRAEMVPMASFLDYLYGGIQINLMVCGLCFTIAQRQVAIDFTASNGFIHTANSLHSIRADVPNQYEHVIRSVGSILMPYDYDGMVAAYGFGAKLPGSQDVHFNFHLNLNPSNPEVPGIDGLLQAYHNVLPQLEFYGPTNFRPTIDAAALISAQHHKAGLKIGGYLVLLIITDGEITDMDETVKAIAQASELPLSVVIVGVGSANFDKMEALDGDDIPRAEGVPPFDIVQFVPFRQFNNPYALAQEVYVIATPCLNYRLAEIPKQFVSYMRRNSVVPRAPVTVAPLQAAQASI